MQPKFTIVPTERCTANLIQSYRFRCTICFLAVKVFSLLPAGLATVGLVFTLPLQLPFCCQAWPYDGKHAYADTRAS